MKKHGYLATTLILLAGIVIWLQYIYAISSAGATTWGYNATDNATFGNSTGYGAVQTGMHFDIGTLFNGLATQLGAFAALAGIIGAIAIVTSIIFPNPYILFAGVALFLYSLSNIIQLMFSKAGFPSFISDFVMMLVFFIFVIDIISWLKGGGMP